MSTTSWAPSAVLSNHSGMSPALQQYETFERLGNTYHCIGLSNNLGFIALNQGRLDEALACYQSGLASLEQTDGSPYLQALFHASLGDTLVRRGDIKAARQHLQTSLDYCERIQARDFYPELYCLLAEAALLDDELDEAEVLGQRSLALTRELNLRGEEGRALRVLGEIAMARGQAEQAEACFDQSLSVFKKVGDDYQGARSRMFLACLSALAGKREAGLDALDLCVPVLERLGAERYVTAARALREEIATDVSLFNGLGG